jgi:tetratricopeptide (TPR) repeat protein
MNETSRALKAWVRATSLKPTHSQAWLNSIVLLEQEGRLKEAKEMSIKASRILRKDDTLQFLMGNVHGKLEEYEGAKKYFESAINLCRESGRAVPAKYWSNLGKLG